MFLHTTKLYQLPLLVESTVDWLCYVVMYVSMDYQIFRSGEKCIWKFMFPALEHEFCHELPPLFSCVQSTKLSQLPLFESNRRLTMLFGQKCSRALAWSLSVVVVCDCNYTSFLCFKYWSSQKIRCTFSEIEYALSRRTIFLCGMFLQTTKLYQLPLLVESTEDWLCTVMMYVSMDYQFFDQGKKCLWKKFPPALGFNSLLSCCIFFICRFCY